MTSRRLLNLSALATNRIVVDSVADAFKAGHKVLRRDALVGDTHAYFRV